MSVRVIAHIAVVIILIMATPCLSILEGYMYDSYDDFLDELWPIDQNLQDMIYDNYNENDE